MALTTESIRAKKPKATRQEYADGGGLYLVVQPSGAKSWAVRYLTADKARRKVTLGTYLDKRTVGLDGSPAIGTAHTLTEARAAAKVIAARVVQGADPARERSAARAPAPDRTIEALVGRWKKSFEIKKGEDVEYTKRSAKEMFRRMDNYVAADTALGKRRIDKVERSEWADLWDKITADNGPIMANRCFETTRLFLKWCVGRAIIDKSPLDGMAKPNPDHETERERTLSDTELRAVWNAASEVGQPYGPLVRLLVLTGQRRGEVAGMTDAEMSGGVWTLKGERTKNGRTHIVPLTAPMLAEMEAVERIGERGLVFTTTGRAPVSGWSRWKRAFDVKCGVSGWVLHDLRRTVATGLQRLGVPLQVTEAVLNHFSGSRDALVRTYQTHDYADEKREALQIWNRFVVDVIAHENRCDAFQKLNDVQRRDFNKSIRADDKAWSKYVSGLGQTEQRQAA